MPFALLIIGAVLLIAAVRNTTDGPTGLFTLVQGDFTGTNNFLFWMVAILLIGAVGYIPKLKPVSVALLGLLVLVLFLAKGDPSKVGGGFFTQFTTALNTTTTATAATGTAATATTAAPAATGIGGLASALPSLMNPLSTLIH